MKHNQDTILEMFFDPQRWQYAIDKGIGKDIRKDHLYQLTKPETRIEIYKKMRDGNYAIFPPHIAEIPKENGDKRIVYVNEPVDRIVLGIANDLFFELMPELIHPRCKSYQKGMGCGKVVQEVSQKVVSTEGDIIGWKSDLSKYFDSVPLPYIDEVFDMIEAKYGESALVKVIRNYYHSDVYFDLDNNVCECYQSLKQGCAVAAFLANAILYDVDEYMSEKFNGYYVRYSDDMLYIGEDYEKAMEYLQDALAGMRMKLNDKKVELLRKDRWFKFLGYSIKGASISLSKSRIKTFQKEIEGRTIRKRGVSLQRATNLVNSYLYKGNGEFSWATQILSVCNVREDIDKLNTFAMDCIRAVATGKTKIGGLGYIANGNEGCVSRGLGRNVKANREKTPKAIEGYLTLGCMQNAMRTSRSVYNTLVASL